MGKNIIIMHNRGMVNTSRMHDYIRSNKRRKNIHKTQFREFLTFNGCGT